MTEVLAAQPYPSLTPYVSLNKYVVGGWQTSGSFNLMAAADGNRCDLNLYTRFGTDRMIAEGLPEWVLPARNQPLVGYQMGIGAVVVQINPDGTLFLPTWSAGDFSGTSNNVVVAASYLRRAP